MLFHNGEEVTGGIVVRKYGGFATERCIQNTVYTHDAYETGSAIRAGHSVCQPPHGNVVILPGANIILDSEGATLLAPGVEVLPGATLEVR